RSFGECRVMRQAGGAFFKGLRKPTHLPQNAGAVEITPGKFRPQVHTAAETAVRQSMFAAHFLKRAQLEQRPVMPRVELQSSLQLRYRLVQAVLAAIGRGQEVMIACAGSSDGPCVVLCACRRRRVT